VNECPFSAEGSDHGMVRSNLSDPLLDPTISVGHVRLPFISCL